MGPTRAPYTPHPQTDLDWWCVKAFIPMDAAIAGRSLFYTGHGNPGTLCGPHSGPPHSLSYLLTSEHCVIDTFDTYD